VSISGRKMRVLRPRLCMKRVSVTGGDVSIPAFEAMRLDSGLTGHLPNEMMRGVSTRNRLEILPEACEGMGVSKSSASRHFVRASDEECRIPELDSGGRLVMCGCW